MNDITEEQAGAMKNGLACDTFMNLKMTNKTFSGPFSR